jgi:hypothetical protein
MKELFLISAYLTTKVQEGQLRNLVSKLKQNNRDVLVVSHTSIPSDIVELCDYYLYDKDNPLIPCYETDVKWVYAEPGEMMSFTKFNVFNYWNYGVASLKTHYHGLLLAKEFGYDIVHFLIYDTDFDSLDEFNDNNFLLDTYDVVYYAVVNNSWLPSGSISSYNIKNYSVNELMFNKELLIKSQKHPPSTPWLPHRQGHMAETLLYENLIFPKNGFKKFLSLKDKRLKINLSEESDKQSTKLVLNCAVVDPTSLDVFWLVHDPRLEFPTSLDLALVVNDNQTINHKTIANVRNLHKLGNLKEINNLKFFSSNKLIEEIDFTDKINKDFFKDNSVINFL